MKKKTEKFTPKWNENISLEWHTSNWPKSHWMPDDYYEIFVLDSGFNSPSIHTFYDDRRHTRTIGIFALHANDDHHWWLLGDMLMLIKWIISWMETIGKSKHFEFFNTFVCYLCLFKKRKEQEQNQRYALIHTQAKKIYTVYS